MINRPAESPYEWHQKTVDHLKSILLPDKDVLALGLFGSFINGTYDEWSDVDLLLVVGDQTKEKFYPLLNWLDPIGTIYTYNQSSGVFSSTTRVCFEDFRRLDILIVTESMLARLEEWERVPFQNGLQPIFSRSPITDSIFIRKAFPDPAPLPELNQLEAILNEFLFKGALAVIKVVRGDLLIAFHLCLDLLRDCCLLQMILRDRQEGRTYHKTGGATANTFIREFRPIPTSTDSLGILNTVEESVHCFDGLVTELAPGFRNVGKPLLEAIERAKKCVSSSDGIVAV